MAQKGGAPGGGGRGAEEGHASHRSAAPWCRRFGMDLVGYIALI